MSIKKKPEKKPKKPKKAKKPKSRKSEYWVPIYNERGMIVAYTAVVLEKRKKAG